jgi:predicted nucleic acid-binding Zn ribbon protein
MPIFDTKCTVCGHEEEIIIPMSEDLPPCRNRPVTYKAEGAIESSAQCGGKREKVPSRTSAHFKGGGWTPRLTGGRTE